MRLGDGARDLADAPLEQVAHLGGEGADGAAQHHLLGDHVVGIAAMELGDRDHALGDRIEVARHDRLQRHHDLGARDHRIAAPVRHRAVPTLAGQPDLHPVGGGHDRPGAHAEGAERRHRPVVQTEHARRREALEQALLDHHATAAVHLLGGLKDEVHGAVEVARLGEISGGAEQHRGVAVMAARVHLAGHASRRRVAR